MNAGALIHVVNVWVTRFSPTPWQVADMYTAAAGAIRSVSALDEDLAREAWHGMIVIGGDNFTLTACHADAGLSALLKGGEAVPALVLAPVPEPEPTPEPAPEPALEPAPEPKLAPVSRGGTQADRAASRKAAAAKADAP